MLKKDLDLAYFAIQMFVLHSIRNYALCKSYKPIFLQSLEATKGKAPPAGTAKKGGKKKSGKAIADPNAAFTNALAHKEKLLEYDRTRYDYTFIHLVDIFVIVTICNSGHRTRVIDDESDYFKSDANKWLNPKQKEVLRAREQELRDKRHGSRREIKVTLDFAGNCSID